MVAKPIPARTERCPLCRAPIEPGAEVCAACGRLAYQRLVAAHDAPVAPAPPARRRGGLVNGCASLIAAGLLLMLGLGLLLFLPLVGVVYFLALGVIVLLRVALR